MATITRNLGQSQHQHPLSSIIIETNFTQCVKCCPWSSTSRQHFTNFKEKIFNDDLDARHYLYTILILIHH